MAVLRCLAAAGAVVGLAGCGQAATKYVSTCQDEHAHVRVDYKRCLAGDHRFTWALWRTGEHYPAIGEPSEDPVHDAPQDQLGDTITDPSGGVARDDSEDGDSGGAGVSGGGSGTGSDEDNTGGGGDEDGGSGGDEGGSSGGAAGGEE